MSVNKRLIVFDCDGTLADSQYLIVEAIQNSFRNTGFLPPSRQDILRSIGLSLPEALRTLAPVHAQGEMELLLTGYRECANSLRRNAEEPLFQGAASLLFNLAAREDIALGIATGKSRRGLDRLLFRQGLSGIFSTIQTADDAPSKPHPAMLLQAMKETGTPPEVTIMIGDTTYDMIMAGCANVPGIGVTWGYHSQSELKKAGAKKIVSSFPELAVALEATEPLMTPFGEVA